VWDEKEHICRLDKTLVGYEEKEGMPFYNSYNYGQRRYRQLSELTNLSRDLFDDVLRYSAEPSAEQPWWTIVAVGHAEEFLYLFDTADSDQMKWSLLSYAHQQGRMDLIQALIDHLGGREKLIDLLDDIFSGYRSMSEQMQLFCLDVLTEKELKRYILDRMGYAYYDTDEILMRRPAWISDLLTELLKSNGPTRGIEYLLDLHSSIMPTEFQPTDEQLLLLMRLPELGVSHEGFNIDPNYRIDNVPLWRIAYDAGNFHGLLELMSPEIPLEAVTEEDVKILSEVYL
jgi:hypothetical protein